MKIEPLELLSKGAATGGFQVKPGMTEFGAMLRVGLFIVVIPANAGIQRYERKSC